MTTITTPPRHTLRDMNDSILPPGISKHQRVWAPIDDTALPSWMALSWGTAEVQSAAAGRPGVTLTMSGSTSNHVTLRLGGPLRLHPGLVAASIRVIGAHSLGEANRNQLYLRMEDVGTNPANENSGTTRGVLLGSQCVDPAVSTTLGLTTLVVHGGGAPAQAQHKFSTSYPQAQDQHKFVAVDMGLHVNFEQGVAYGFDGDDVIHYRDVGAAIPRDIATLHPRITAVARDTYRLFVQSIEYTLWY